MGVDPSGMGGTHPPNNLVGGTEYLMSPPPIIRILPRHFWKKSRWRRALLKKITMKESLFKKNHDDGEPFWKKITMTESPYEKINTLVPPITKGDLRCWYRSTVVINVNKNNMTKLSLLVNATKITTSRCNKILILHIQYRLLIAVLLQILWSYKKWLQWVGTSINREIFT